MFLGAHLFAATAKRWAPSFGMTNITIAIISFEIVSRAAGNLWINLRFWTSDFGFKEFCQFY